MPAFREFLRIWLLISLATLLARLLLNPAPARAEEAGHHAGLVVRDSEGRITYAWVPFPGDEIDGITLLKRSGIPTVTVGFGALGEGVCAISGQGCSVGECRRTVCQASGANAPYWQLFRQDPADPSIWSWQALGGSATRVHEGDLLGWSWTGDDPHLPAVTPEQVAQLAGAGDGTGRAASFRTYLPEGVRPAIAAGPPGRGEVAAASAVLCVIGLAGVALSQREARARTRNQLRSWNEADPPPARALDPRAWLLWAAAAVIPPLVGRNPWPIVATLLAVISVWVVWSRGAAGRRWRPLLRLAFVFGVVSVVFNVLTVRAGDVVIGHLPDSWPIIGGALTLNALVFGVLGALAIFTLVAVSATLGVVLDWTLAIRLLPDRMAPLAVAGSVAWSYLPQTTLALGEIRDAQLARGFRPRGARDVLPLLMPLLAGGLERAMMTAEALEARAFGAPQAGEGSPSSWRLVALLSGLTTIATGAYLLVLGSLPAGAALLGAGALFLIASVARRTTPHEARRTRYREPVWEGAEWAVAVASLAVLAAQVVLLARDPGAFRYEPYPVIAMPAINLPLLALLGLLLTPAAVRP